MRRLALTATLLVGGIAALATSALGDDSHTYFIELDNAFGLVEGSEVQVAGVTQGTIDRLYINSDKRAVARVELSGPLSALGEDTICSAEPQSLIAEYFLDCDPKGPPIEEGAGEDKERANAPDIPVEQTRQTVQQDLVQSGLRQPYRERLGLLINEFGTALAGNAENLNEAIRRGAPALRQTRKITRVLADQNQIIRRLNVDSDEIMAELADRREDVRRFVEEARDTAAISATRRGDLSRNFEILDDFLAELQPTMRELNQLAVSQTPLLADLRRSGPGLNTLSENLPDFNRAGTRSLRSLGDAANVGRRALRNGREEVRQLARATRGSVSVATDLSKFLRDVDDPRRAVEIDQRVERDTGRSNPRPGQRDTMGYTGLEGLLNYVYYQPGALNQFDEVSHLLHFSIFEIGNTPCTSYNPEQQVPSRDGEGTTRSIENADRCVAWVGENQPQINQPLNVPPYHPSVCRDGSTDHSICNPGGSGSNARSEAIARQSAEASRGRLGGDPLPGLDALPGDQRGNGGGNGGRDGGNGGALDGLGNILDLPGAGKDDRSPNRPKGGRSGEGSPDAGATRDLLGFLLGN
jgi:ABC-type transporter Mla subunit MlaD